MTFSRIIIATALLSFCFVSLKPAAAAEADDAGKYIEKVATKALAIISNTKADKDKKQLQLNDLFVDSIDLPWVGRFVLGQYWRQATDAQKKDYLKAYQDFVITHYTSHFIDYTSGTFKITNVKKEDGDYTVSMELKGDKENDEPVLVDYRVRHEGAGYKIFDIIVEGVSLITTQRSEFGSVVERHNIDYLIDQLKTKALSPDKDDSK